MTIDLSAEAAAQLRRMADDENVDPKVLLEALIHVEHERRENRKAPAK